MPPSGLPGAACNPRQPRYSLTGYIAPISASLFTWLFPMCLSPNLSLIRLSGLDFYGLILAWLSKTLTNKVGISGTVNACWDRGTPPHTDTSAPEESFHSQEAYSCLLEIKRKALFKERTGHAKECGVGLRECRVKRQPLPNRCFGGSQYISKVVNKPFFSFW